MKKLIIFVTTTGLLFMGCKSLNLAGSASKQDRQIASNTKEVDLISNAILKMNRVVLLTLPLIKNPECQKTLQATNISYANAKYIEAEIYRTNPLWQSIKEKNPSIVTDIAGQLVEKLEIHVNNCEKLETVCKELDDPSDEIKKQLGEENKTTLETICVLE